jgi:hypothetical protein
MKRNLEEYDLRTLLDLYMVASREFSNALTRNCSWDELKRRRSRIVKINDCINKKYKEQLAGERRRDSQPPHGD